MVGHFSGLQLGLQTVPTSLVPLNCLLSWQTGSLLSHLLSHSGTVAVVIIILQTSQRCTRKVWWLVWPLVLPPNQTLFANPALLGKCSNLFPSSASRATQPLELVCMALSQLLQGKDIAIGWPSLMMQPPTVLRCNSNGKAMHLMPSKPTRHLQRTTSNGRWRSSRMTKGGNTCPRHLSNSQMNAASTDGIPLEIDHSKMV